MVNNMVQICAVLHLTCVSGRRFQESSLRKLRPAKMGTTAPRIAFFSDDLVRPGVYAHARISHVDEEHVWGVVVKAVSREKE